MWLKRSFAAIKAHVYLIYSLSHCAHSTVCIEYFPDTIWQFLCKTFKHLHSDTRCFLNLAFAQYMWHWPNKHNKIVETISPRAERDKCLSELGYKASGVPHTSSQPSPRVDSTPWEQREWATHTSTWKHSRAVSVSRPTSPERCSPLWPAQSHGRSFWYSRRRGPGARRVPVVWRHCFSPGCGFLLTWTSQGQRSAGASLPLRPDSAGASPCSVRGSAGV